MATKTIVEAQSRKGETPFGAPTWQWNFVPLGGHPTRARCQKVVSDDERAAGAALIERYRSEEKIANDNSIESRQDQLRSLKGIGAELMRREIASCDHDKWLKAEEKLRELRKEAFELVKPIFKRLAKSLDAELNDAALAAEQRLDTAGIPVRHPDGVWTLHHDAICLALWSQRITVERKLPSLDVGAAVGVIQFLTSDEDGVPFSWAQTTLA